MATKTNVEKGHMARAKMSSLPISTKHSIEISRHLRYKTLSESKKILEDAVALKKAIPFVRHHRDLGHKKGIGPGRYAPNAAAQFLKLLNSVESNAQDLGLDASNLRIRKIVANKASIPQSGGRVRGSPKRTHLEIEVEEFTPKEKKKFVPRKREAKKVVPKTEAKVGEKTTEVKEETKVEAPVAEVKEESKSEEKVAGETQ